MSFGPIVGQAASGQSGASWTLSSGVLSPVEGVDSVEVPEGTQALPGLRGPGADTGARYATSQVIWSIDGKEGLRLTSSILRIIPARLQLAGNNDVLEYTSGELRLQDSGETEIALDGGIVTSEGDTAISTLRYHDGTSVVTAAMTVGAADSESAGFRACRVPN